MNRTVTLEQIISRKPCYSTERILEIANGRESITALEVFDLKIPNKDKLWLLLHVDFFSKLDLLMMSAAFTESVLHLYENVYHNDISRDAIRVARLVAMSEVDSTDAYVVHGVAYNAYAVAQVVEAAHTAQAAGHTAYAAANVVNGFSHVFAHVAEVANCAYFAADAAETACHITERKKQFKIIKMYIESDLDD